MLVLGRKPGEAIRVMDRTVIRILQIRSGGQVRLGIEAPPEIAVHREEVWQAIQDERKS